MEYNTIIFIDTALIVVCLAMAIVFLTIPIPKTKGLYKYRISLRFLAVAYLVVALIKTAVMLLKITQVDLISMERLTISSFQATLYNFALITLINPRFINRRFLYYNIMPVIVLNILYILVASRFGHPVIPNPGKLIELALQPPVLVRELLVLFYIFQIIYFCRLFILKVLQYKKNINDYFSESYRLYLPWIEYCYFTALTIGICALISCFFQSENLLLLFNIVCIVFYFVFGICYIQYPQTFKLIEPAIYAPGSIPTEVSKSNKHVVWNELKEVIIQEKYYLRPEVNIEDMAHHLKIGRTTLSKFINSEENMNFNGWVNSLRIEEAKQLLLTNPHYTLIEISEMVGYSESSNFSRQFKLITKLSPSVWRNNYKA